jgi:predicted N-acetyltransferase YhbS
LLIRRETPQDVEAIDEVHRQAFAPVTENGREPVEVGLVRALHADRGWVPALSLVAEDDGRVIGHVVASTLGISPTDPTWGAHFQARPLAAFDPDLRGTFRYAAPFDAL